MTSDNEEKGFGGLSSRVSDVANSHLEEAEQGKNADAVPPADSPRDTNGVSSQSSVGSDADPEVRSRLQDPEVQRGDVGGDDSPGIVRADPRLAPGWSGVLNTETIPTLCQRERRHHEERQNTDCSSLKDTPHGISTHNWPR